MAVLRKYFGLVGGCAFLCGVGVSWFATVKITLEVKFAHNFLPRFPRETQTPPAPGTPNSGVQPLRTSAIREESRALCLATTTE
jgi:hypothetical protein